MVDLLLQALKENGITKVSLVHEEKRLGDVMRNFSDTSKSKRAMGWQSETLLKNVK